MAMIQWYMRDWITNMFRYTKWRNPELYFPLLNRWTSCNGSLKLDLRFFMISLEIDLLIMTTFQALLPFFTCFGHYKSGRRYLKNAFQTHLRTYIVCCPRLEFFGSPLNFFFSPYMIHKTFGLLKNVVEQKPFVFKSKEVSLMKSTKSTK